MMSEKKVIWLFLPLGFLLGIAEHLYFNHAAQTHLDRVESIKQIEPAKREVLGSLTVPPAPGANRES